MEANTDFRRQPTAAEIAAEKEPICSYDLMQVTTCSKYRRPRQADCLRCLKSAIVGAAANNQPSEAMRFTIALIKFYEVNAAW